MKTSMRGLTLLEVLIAVAVLAIGVLAVAQLQATGLRYTSTAEALNRTTRLVRGELAWQRQAASEPGGTSCHAGVPSGFESCTVEIVPCAYEIYSDGTGDLVCQDEGSSVVVAPTTYRVSVSAVGPRGQELTLSTLWTGVYIGGSAGSVLEGGE